MKKTKYLLRKTSGSRSKYKHNWLEYERVDNKGDFSKEDIAESFPKVEAMSTKNKCNGVDTTLVKKWLYSKVGQDFNTVYDEFLSRVQTQYLETHKDCIYWYVYKPHQVKFEDDKVYYLWYGNTFLEMKSGFYIHPETNTLCRVVEEKKRTLSHKEGKKKAGEYKTQKNKSHKLHKEIEKERGDKAAEAMKERKGERYFQVGDKVSFYIDTDLTEGTIEFHNPKTKMVNIKIWKGVVTNIPVSEIL